MEFRSAQGKSGIHGTLQVAAAKMPILSSLPLPRWMIQIFPLMANEHGTMLGQDLDRIDWIEPLTALRMRL